MQLCLEQFRRPLESFYFSLDHDLHRLLLLILLVQDKRMFLLNFIKLLEYLKMILSGMGFLLYWMYLLRLFEYYCL